MRAVIQRVKQSWVKVDGHVVAQIGSGLLVLLGVAGGDTAAAADYLADKIAHLRIFSDHQDKMNLSVRDTGGEILVVSQFTLLGDCRKGRRPSFVQAAKPETAQQLYHHFANRLRQADLPVSTGQFQAAMEVALINDGPVTLILESRS